MEYWKKIAREEGSLKAEEQTRRQGTKGCHQIAQNEKLVLNDKQRSDGREKTGEAMGSNMFD